MLGVSRALGLVRSGVLLSDLSLVGGTLVPNRIKHNPCKPFQIFYIQTRETSFTPTGEHRRKGLGARTRCKIVATGSHLVSRYFSLVT